MNVLILQASPRANGNTALQQGKRHNSSPQVGCCTAQRLMFVFSCQGCYILRNAHSTNSVAFIAGGIEVIV